MTAFRATVEFAIMSAVVTAGAVSVASAQLQPPELPGLRGAPFTSMNPPDDVPSYGEGAE